MRISDWSSDVCSSDLDASPEPAGGLTSISSLIRIVFGLPAPAKDRSSWLAMESFLISAWRIAVSIFALGRASSFSPKDRKSVVSGQSVSVRVDLGGRRIIKNKNITTIQNKQNYTPKRS